MGYGFGSGEVCGEVGAGKQPFEGSSGGVLCIGTFPGIGALGLLGIRVGSFDTTLPS